MYLRTNPACETNLEGAPPCNQKSRYDSNLWQAVSKGLFSNFLKYEFLDFVLSKVLGSTAVSIMTYYVHRCLFAKS